MKIEELIIDGFKSYAVRTVISGWDSQFNAITGLNGSGKSNILDAICFVLGITNMHTVRAQNLQDLIYKRGQAGITRASVTIVFDNRDTSKSPIGFEMYPQVSVTRQILMGGTSKYLINGHRALQQTVQNLFQSVQLNINNPNFLIMQGRITKVLNMRPTEILAMIEEAAGTRMFEERKEKAFRTMQRKEHKVDEINTLLREEIEPKLSKLRAEKKTFLEYQHVYNDLERLSRLIVAYDYTNLQNKMQSLSASQEKRETAFQQEEIKINNLQQEIHDLKEKITELDDNKESELRLTGGIMKMESLLDEILQDVARISASIKMKQTSYEEETNSLAQLQTESHHLSKNLAEVREKHSTALEEYNQKKRAFEKLQAKTSSQEELVSSLTTGLSSKEGQEFGYARQLEESRTQLNSLVAQRETARLKFNEAKTTMSSLAPKLDGAKEALAAIHDRITAEEREVEQLRSQLSNNGLDQNNVETKRREFDALQRDIQHANNELEGLRGKLAHLEFHYADPVPNFDRSKVRGLVAQLFTLGEHNYDKATALEVAAGGRLFNVVVENEQVGTQLLRNGRLRKRVTIIPLNKISSFVAAAEKVSTAKRLTPDKVHLALELIGFEEELLPAMRYVFGSTLICDGPETAKTVTFNPSVHLKSVTYDGDVYDPSGFLTGGSSTNSSGLLKQIQRYNELTKFVHEKSKIANSLLDEIRREDASSRQYNNFQKELVLREHQLELSKEQLKTDSSVRLLETYKNAEEQHQSLKLDIDRLNVEINEQEVAVKKIEEDMEGLKTNRGSKIKELEQELLAYKQSMNTMSSELKITQKNYQKYQLSLEQIEAELDKNNQKRSDLEQNVDRLRSELSQANDSLGELEGKKERLLVSITKEKEKFAMMDQRTRDMQQLVKEKTEIINALRLKLQQMQYENERLERERGVAKVALEQLLRDNDWIEDQKQYFGRADTVFDFTNQNIKQSRSQLQSLKERHSAMRKTVNSKVMNMIDGVEKKEERLRTMIRTIHRDKLKIQETVKSLDQFKRSALEKTWTEVNSSFGDIFDELLPGNTAKLLPPEGKDITQGLEIHVRIGSIWKSSLAELSGGQRSLVALALIMSLLRYKPAPMYILDEVDAALDLSHTQNIGSLIKSKFRGSQFIVVSLKEGMFTNANRLFHVRFLDGSSVVQAK
ncbi:condensin complex subunit Cut14 [Schizosaccharomyces japonicus yFS275]|uniref:Structural maintenance of chromosomes protein n=1 Tax=Schizosaccharomyces japonicus (strain yFS275 / FY16936) TaxID=402676 RepID=B6K564_SCHJY|nr:condensin complex subunit Cut14 [Schizosaccharomyces japonicus yFS275]EEB08668.1 condensin complex subunit Cut14 [Schizosaccharomyces japonicus yFS275]